MIRGKNGHLVLSLIKKPDICVYLSQIKHNTKKVIFAAPKLYKYSGAQTGVNFFNDFLTFEIVQLLNW